MKSVVDVTHLQELDEFFRQHSGDSADFSEMYAEAVNFIEFFDWCKSIEETYVGIFHPGIVGIFLFKIKTNAAEVADFILVVVGDLPPAYITPDDCKTPWETLDGYIGAMLEWVYAAEKGESVVQKIPVNAPASQANAKLLKAKLDFLDKEILQTLMKE